MGKQAPAPGNFQDAAAKSSQSSRPNVSNPFSQTKWDGNNVTQSLSPEVQAAFGQMKPFDFGQFGPVQSGDAARDAAIESSYNAATRRLDPQFRQRGESLDVQLANQGLDPSSAAGRGAARDLAAQRNDAYSGAMANAQAQGTAAGDSAFRNNMMARQQSIAEALRQRGMGLEDLKGLQGFMGPLNYGQGADYLGAAGMQSNADFQKWMAENQANSDMVKSGFQLAGSIAPFFMSDERLKMNVRRLPEEVMAGIPHAEWEWKASPGVTQRGVIAQDVEKVAPQFVAKTPSGFLAVDYAGLWRHARGE